VITNDVDHYIHAIALSPAASGLQWQIISGNLPGNMETVRMVSQAKSSRAKSPRAKSWIAVHRARMARRGFVRVEVSVGKDDASLVRQVAAALSDPARQAAARTLLRQRFIEPPKVSLKALLASAPLDGIDLDRGRDLGRDVDL